MNDVTQKLPSNQSGVLFYAEQAKHTKIVGALNDRLLFKHFLQGEIQSIFARSLAEAQLSALIWGSCC